jgi:hypothetical protein
MKAIIVTLIGAVLLGPWTTGASAVQQDGNKQIPLDHPLEQTGRRQKQPGKYTINEPGENVCQAGARQWAGKVNVSEGNAMFYCKWLPIKTFLQLQIRLLPLLILDCFFGRVL